jgi:MFS family permease
LPPTSAIDGWRRFGDPRFRNYHYLALAQGVVGVLAGFDVVIPWALAIGCPPFAAVLLGVLPLAGGMAQLVVPKLLDRTAGNLRGLTILIAALAEPRGLYLAGLVALSATGLLSGPLTLVALALLIGVTSVLSSISSANLLSWHSAVLPDEDRRLVVPRLMAVSLAIGALLLMPIAALLDSLVHVIGLYAYALPFIVSGVLGVVEIAVLFRLRHPGQVIVPPRALAAETEPTPELNRFLRASMVNALGMGVTPATSVFVIAALGMTAGFSMIVGSIGTLTMVAAAAFFGDRLARGSSSRMLRASFAWRAGAMACPLLIMPLPAFAPLFVIASSMLGAIGFAAGNLAANERLYRLIRGPAVIRQHARYLARTSGAMTIGQLAGAAVIGVGGPIGYPAFAALYATSAAIRVIAYRLTLDKPATPNETAAEVSASAAA